MIQSFIDIVKKNQKPNMVVAEIGVYDGDTSKRYIDIIKKNNGHLYALDWFRGNVGAVGDHMYSVKKENLMLETFQKNLIEYLDIITIVKGPSNETISSLQNESLDICFIDADHRYSHVYNDIKLCLPKMKRGGLLCGHDLNVLYDEKKFKSEYIEYDCIDGIHWGVTKAIYDHFQNEVELHNDFVWSKIV
jgi:hypothetical protein